MNADFNNCAPKTIKAVIYVRKGKATNNFLKHIDANNISLIEKQIKHGSVKVVK